VSGSRAAGQGSRAGGVAVGAEQGVRQQGRAAGQGSRAGQQGKKLFEKRI
jgi:hypothetical protein